MINNIKKIDSLIKIQSGSTNQVIILPIKNNSDQRYTIESGNSVELIYPKSEPYLDWQENRSDNRPENGVEVLVKIKRLAPSSWNFETDIWTNGNWDINSISGDPDIEKWAYIPN